MSMHGRLLDGVRSALRDSPRRYLILSLLITGITLIVVAHQAAGRVTALPEEPLRIEALLVTKDRHGHCYLKTEGAGYKVGRGQKYDIECVVADTGHAALFEWSCYDGEISEISEDGSMITWTAPDSSVRTIVEVTASDAANRMVSANVSLNVVSCSVCTFGQCSG
jgi:hypothetical protein